MVDASVLSGTPAGGDFRFASNKLTGPECGTLESSEADCTGTEGQFLLSYLYTPHSLSLRPSWQALKGISVIIVQSERLYAENLGR
jgi:hypothetical protein